VGRAGIMIFSLIQI